MPPNLLTNFEIQKNYQNKPKFNGVYSINDLFKTKNGEGAYIINSDEYESIGTHWIALFVNAEIITYYDSFGVEQILREIREFIGNKNTITNIYRTQAYN